MHYRIAVRVEIRRLGDVLADVFTCGREYVQPVVEAAECSPIDQGIPRSETVTLGEAGGLVVALAVAPTAETPRSSRAGIRLELPATPRASGESS